MHRFFIYLPHIVGLCLVILLAMAVSRGHQHHLEIPLAALLGGADYQALLEGRPKHRHYIASENSQDWVADDFELLDQHGKPWRLSDHREKTVIVHLWSSTCPPCIEEMPEIQAWAELLSFEHDVTLVTISPDKSWDTVAPLFAQGFQVPVLLDPDKSVVEGIFKSKQFPETFIINKQGKIALRIDGRRAWTQPFVMDVLNQHR